MSNENSPESTTTEEANESHIEKENGRQDREINRSKESENIEAIRKYIEQQEKELNEEALRNNSAKQQIDSSKEQGDSAKEQGDSVKEQGDSAKEQGDSSKEQDDSFKEQGDSAKERGDSAKERGDSAMERGVSAKEQGDSSKEQGDSVKEQGDSAKEQVDSAKEPNDSLKEQSDSIKVQDNTIEIQHESVNVKDNSVSEDDSVQENIESLKESSDCGKGQNYSSIEASTIEIEVPLIVEEQEKIETKVDKNESQAPEEKMGTSTVMNMIISDSDLAKKKVKPKETINAVQKGGNSMALSVGSKVEAKDFAELWHPALIMEVDFDEMEVLVHYGDSMKKHDEWISVSSPRLRPLGSKPSTPIPKEPSPEPPVKQEPPLIKEEPRHEEKWRVSFVVGERCLARWRDNRRFIATINEDLGDGNYKIMFDDGVLWTCNTTRLSKLKERSKDLTVDTNLPSTSSTPSPVDAPGPEANSTNSTNSTPVLAPFHTHLFDPTRDYLSSKSERREMKRKLNVKELFNIGQKKKKVEAPAPPPPRSRPVRKPPAKPTTSTPKDKTPASTEKKAKVVKKIKLEEIEVEVKKEIPDAVASIIGMVEPMDTSEIKEEIKTEPVDLDSANSETLSAPECQDMKIDDDVMEDEKLEQFDTTEDTTHEEVIGRIQEVINKLEDGLKNDDPISPTVPTTDYIKIKDEPIEVDVENVTETVQVDVEKPKKPVSKVKKSKKLRLLQEKKVKKQVEKVKSELEEMKRQVEEMRKEMLQKTEALAKTKAAEGQGAEMPESFLLPGEWCCKWVNGQPVGKVSEFEYDGKTDGICKPLPRRSVEVEDKRLPPGWTKHMVRRSVGHSAGKWDVVLVSPDNHRFHTKTDMRHYLEAHPDSDLKSYEHALTDFGVHLKLSRRMGWYKVTPGGEQEPPLPSASHTSSPIVKKNSKWNLKRFVKEKNHNLKIKEKRLSVRIKIPKHYYQQPLPVEDGGDVTVVDPDAPLDVSNETPLEHSYGEQEPPLPSASHISPIAKKNSKWNLKRFVKDKSHHRKAVTVVDPDAPIDVSNETPLEDGYVYVGSLKVQIIENLLRCPAEGCFKNFRNNTLLKMHIKHYHRELRQMLGATPKVLDLAYARQRPTEMELTRMRHEAVNKTIKVKLPRLPKKYTEPKTEPKEISEIKTEVKLEPPEKIPRSMDSPKLRLALNKPVKRPKVLLPVRKQKEPEIKEELEETLIEPKIEVPNMDVLDFETAISTHTVTKPLDFKKKRKTFATVCKKGTSEDEEWFTMNNSDVETRSSYPRSGTPDSKTAEQKLTWESNEEQKEANNYMYTETGERIKIVHMKREEIINCHCGFREEDGLMVQCELCLCWQHALCHNIQKESEVPEKYTCSICLNPRRGRRSARFIHDQDRLYEGLLPGGQPCPMLRRAHELAGNLLRIQHSLHALRVKYHVATKKDHPKLYLWAKDWEMGEIAMTQEKLNSDYSDLNIMISNIGKENLPMKEEVQLEIRTPPSEEQQEERFSQKDNSLGSQALLSGLLSSPGGASLDLPISTSELERLAKTVQAEAEAAVASAPQPEAAIENSACRERLLRHIQRCQALIDARLDSIEAQVAELESQDPSFEDDETADYFPRTKQTIQMLMRDLDTMEELGVIT